MHLIRRKLTTGVGVGGGKGIAPVLGIGVIGIGIAVGFSGVIDGCPVCGA